MRSIALLLVFIAFAAAPLPAADTVSADMAKVLDLGFADAAQDLASPGASPCAVVTRFGQVFTPVISEYTTRSGDARYQERLRRWYLLYCGREPQEAAPGDGD